MSTDLITTLASEQGLDRAEYWKTVCNTVIPGSQSNEQVVAFLAVANQYGLNPLTKEIYAFPSKGGIQPIVSVDGWLKLANSHPQFDGLIADEVREGGEIIAVKCTIYRKDRGHPTVATEYMSECRRNTEPWKQWPVRMLTNKAMIQAIRRAFSFAGIYDPDEGRRIQQASAAEYVEIDQVNATTSAATKTKADELKKRLAAEAGDSTASTGAGEGTSVPPGVAPAPAPADDFELMDMVSLTAYANTIRPRMTTAQKRAAKAAVDANDRVKLLAVIRASIKVAADDGE